eukprot:TRINITY_DN30332_c0_g1_i1.p1 TRINITY_DN30332_c0_g1~~TRINITY_DN30332_c0_g1_i1.p1  ORF type:complete len:139 (+),score=4.05 TRINITY_DN30332_c0_g1_i1:232-648(+)
MSGTLEIFFTMQGTNDGRQLDVSEHETCGAVTERVADAFGVPSSDIRLVFGETPIEPETLLSDILVLHDEVQVVPRVEVVTLREHGLSATPAGVIELLRDRGRTDAEKAYLLSMMLDVRPSLVGERLPEIDTTPRHLT